MPPHDGLHRMLNALDALDTLSHLREQHGAPYRCHGPGVYRGADWVGVLLWQRERGYAGYRTLHLFGVWGRWREAAPWLLIGTRTLSYQASHYTPEAYHQLIRRDFTTYYGDSGAPPVDAANVRYEQAYQAAQRLSLRQRLHEETLRWLHDKA